MLLFCLITAPIPMVAQIQYMQHKQISNPSAMGADNTFSMGTFGQISLYGFDEAPIKAGLQLTIPFATNSQRYSLSEEKNMYIGITGLVESIGVHSSYNFLGSYAYKIRLSTTNYLTLALSMGTGIQHQNYQKLQITEPDITLTSFTDYNFTAAAGAYLHGEKYYISAYSSSLVTDRNCYLQAGLFFPIGRSDLDDNYYFNENQGSQKSFFEINAQAGYSYKKNIEVQASSIFTIKGLIGLGIAWEYPKHIAALATIGFGSFKICYAYQINSFDSNIPTHEVLLKIKINPRSRDGF